MFWLKGTQGTAIALLDRIVCLSNTDGRAVLGRLRAPSGHYRPVYRDRPCTLLSSWITLSIHGMPGNPRDPTAWADMVIQVRGHSPSSTWTCRMALSKELDFRRMGAAQLLPPPAS